MRCVLLEVAESAIGVWGAGRVGVHLAPRSDAHGISDSNPAQTFGYVARELGRRGVAFICARESIDGETRLGPELKRIFQEAGGGVYIATQTFRREDAEQVLQAGEAEAVAWGKQFIANPDLPRRFALGAPLNEPDASTFYGSGPQGYTDYPTLHASATPALVAST